MAEKVAKKSLIGPICLGVLVLQNSLFYLATSEGRIPDKKGHTYFAPTMVAILEVFKASISFLVLFWSQYNSNSSSSSSSSNGYTPLPRNVEEEKHDQSSPSSEPIIPRIANTWSTVKPMVFTKAAWKLSVPATLYVIQTVLAIMGAENLDPTTFMIASQLKFATTALCTSVMLKRTIPLKRWLCLGTLAVGVVMVQLTDQHKAVDPKAAIIAKTSHKSPIIGIIAVILACFISGFASVFLEKILKNGQTNLWATNIQLGAFSLPPALFPMLIDAWKNGLYHPFMYFGFWAWMTVGANVAGGLIVALVIKYADNIQKSLAISAAIVLTFLLSLWMGKVEYSTSAVLGSATVIGSIIAYTRFGVTPAPPTKPNEDKTSDSDLSHVSISTPESGKISQH